MTITWLEDRKRWRVTYRVAGKTFRPTFKTKTDATTFASNKKDEVRDYGAEWAAMPVAVRAELVQCWMNAKARGYTISEACRLYENQGSTSVAPVELEKVIEQFTTAKTNQGMRPESLRVLKTTLKQFKLGREKMLVNLITSDLITKWMDSQEGWGPQRRRGVIIDLNNLWNWAIKARLATFNPMAAIDRPTIDMDVPEVFTPERCEALLKLCRGKHKPLLPWLCISLFAGLRDAEARRLDWERVKPGFIDLREKVTKGRERRLVTIHPTLEAWMKLFRKESGPVCVRNHRKRCLALKKDFGKFPRNVLRHSYISYELARSKNVDATAIEAGNSPDVIFRHYREVVSPDDAQRFWSLLP